jgi:hypothetical protein
VAVVMIVSEVVTEGGDEAVKAVEEEVVDVTFRADEEEVGKKALALLPDVAAVTVILEAETEADCEEVMVEAELVEEASFRMERSGSVLMILNGPSKVTPKTITMSRGKDMVDMVDMMKVIMIATGMVHTVVGVVGEGLVEVAVEVVSDVVVAPSNKENREHRRVARAKQPTNRGKDMVDTMKAIMIATGVVDTMVGVADEGVVEVALADVVVAPRKENREYRQVAREMRPCLLKVILLRLLPHRLVAETTAVGDSEVGEEAAVADAALTERKLQARSPRSVGFVPRLIVKEETKQLVVINRTTMWAMLFGDGWEESLTTAALAGLLVDNHQ